MKGAKPLASPSFLLSQKCWLNPAGKLVSAHRAQRTPLLQTNKGVISFQVQCIESSNSNPRWWKYPERTPPLQRPISLEYQPPLPSDTLVTGMGVGWRRRSGTVPLCFYRTLLSANSINATAGSVDSPNKSFTWHWSSWNREAVDDIAIILILTLINPPFYNFMRCYVSTYRNVNNQGFSWFRFWSSNHPFPLGFKITLGVLYHGEFVLTLIKPF